MSNKKQSATIDTPLQLYDTKISSRLLLGTAQYPTPTILEQAIRQSATKIVTVSLRREQKGGDSFWSFLKKVIDDVDAHILPNTAGCCSVKEVVNTAYMAREVFATNWIKLELISNTDTLHPDVLALIEAVEILVKDDFCVFPYTTEDISIAERLVNAGCRVIMPWAAPIGSGRGLNNKHALMSLRSYIPNIPLIIDAGIGTPSHATECMEIGYDAILINTAIAKAGNPVTMAQAFTLAVQAGRMAYLSLPIKKRNFATPSTPITGQGFR